MILEPSVGWYLGGKLMPYVSLGLSGCVIAWRKIVLDVMGRPQGPRMTWDKPMRLVSRILDLVFFSEKKTNTDP